MKKWIFLLVIGLLIYAFYADVFAPYPHSVSIVNESDHPIIIHDSPVTLNGIVVKTLFIDNKRNTTDKRDSNYFRGTHMRNAEFKYALFDKPNRATLVWQEAKVSCKDIAFRATKDCEFLPVNEQFYRQALDLKAMRQTSIGRQSGKWCGPYCGRRVLNTIITIHPVDAPERVSVRLTRSSKGGATW